MTERVLIVEDEPGLRETLAYSLRRQGYDVFEVGDGPSALDAARRYQPGLVLLDIMLPQIDGFEVCRTLRREMPVPILILTARDSEIDRVLGLEMGADDYLTKPFSMRELVARVKAIFRRVQLERDVVSGEPLSSQDGILRSEALKVNTRRSEVLLEDSKVALKPKEYELLLFFLRNPGKTFSRDVILDRVWGWDYSGGHRTVDVHVRWLREKIEKEPANPRRIVTVWGMGYRFDG